MNIPVAALFRIPLLLLCASGASAQSTVWVVPAADVTNGVNVREAPTTDSTSLGLLEPGGRLPLNGAVPFWYEVRLEGDQPGFVSKRWTELREELPPLAGDWEYELHAIDVGTGLAILVRGPDFSLLYDGGSKDDRRTGDDNRLVNYLRAAFPEMTTIDHLVLSHPHQDHVELLADVVDRYEVREIWDSGAPYDNCGYRFFIEAVALEEGVRYHTPFFNFGSTEYEFPGDACGSELPDSLFVPVALSSRIDDSRIEIGEGAAMRFLHASNVDVAEEVNKASLVLRLELGDRAVLLAGDAEAGPRANPETEPLLDSVEGKLLACCVDLLKSDVLVVGHHGSSTSSRRAFLDAVGATHYVVSSGPTKYGTVVLPDSEVIDELASRGAVFRTDDDDDGCKTAAAKIGSDADDRPGGCTNVVMKLRPESPIEAALSTVVD